MIPEEAESGKFWISFIPEHDSIFLGSDFSINPQKMFSIFPRNIYVFDLGFQYAEDMRHCEPTRNSLASCVKNRMDRLFGKDSLETVFQKHENLTQTKVMLILNS